MFVRIDDAPGKGAGWVSKQTLVLQFCDCGGLVSCANLFPPEVYLPFLRTQSFCEDHLKKVSESQ
jgi:hypothetical protein